MRGLYSFTVSIYDENTSVVFIRVNGETIVSVAGTGGGAQSAFLMLEANDRVSTHLRDAGSALREHSTIAYYNTFSGALYTQL